MNVKTVRNGLIAAAIGTGALFAASVVKTPKQADAAESQVKTEQTYEWNPQQSVVANVKDGAVTTYNVATDAIKEGADKATDHPAPLGAALALELMGVGAAGAAVKKNKVKAEEKARIEEQNKELDERREYLRKQKAFDSAYDAMIDAVGPHMEAREKYMRLRDEYDALREEADKYHEAYRDDKPKCLGYESAHGEDGWVISEGHYEYESRSQVIERTQKAWDKYEECIKKASGMREELERLKKEYEDAKLKYNNAILENNRACDEFGKQAFKRELVK